MAGGGHTPGKAHYVNTDARIAVTFQGHQKTRRLRRRCGAEGVESLCYLWAWTSANRPRGVFTNMTPADIADVCGWAGDPVEFVAALMDPGAGALPEQRGFFEKIMFEGSEWYACHDWQEHNPYAYHGPERSEAARVRANHRWGKTPRNPLNTDASRNAPSNAPRMTSGNGPTTADALRNAYRNASSNAGSMQEAMPEASFDARGNAPSPDPSPDPYPNPLRRNAHGNAPCIAGEEGAHALIPEPDSDNGAGKDRRAPEMETPQSDCPKCGGTGKFRHGADEFVCFRCQAGAEAERQVERDRAARTHVETGLTPIASVLPATLHVEPPPTPDERAAAHEETPF